ncbi:MAG TPA: 4-hydroxyproline epimerase [Alphaproteobacteria bacterium]|nr:4-hydroxyproline epimerase [Alphaproteobacteria bacterium]
MANHTFFCIDAHTCGNPVRVVAGGGPPLKGASMSERRQHFLREYDWIRTGLMFEPRGHDMMSGSILYPPTREDCDIGILFIETSGCLPMCGHGTIGTVTVALERGLVTPRKPGELRLETPAGLVVATYTQSGAHIEAVRITNVPSFLHSPGLEVACDGIGPLTVDVAYGGNFYAIVEAQPGYRDLEALTPADVLRLSPLLRKVLNERYEFVHPENPTIRGLSHVMWTGKPRHPDAHARNAVFYGDHAIDRSPCGTGTSARMAQKAARGELKPGDEFVHESIIGSLFRGRVEGRAKVGNYEAIIPSIEGWARITGLNTIFIEDRDPYAKGFQVA